MPMRSRRSCPPIPARPCGGWRRPGFLEEADADILQNALSLWRRLQAVLRLTAADGFAEDKAPEGQKQVLVRAGGADSFTALKQNMDELASQVRYCFQKVIEHPAGE